MCCCFDRLQLWCSLLWSFVGLRDAEACSHRCTRRCRLMPCAGAATPTLTGAKRWAYGCEQDLSPRSDLSLPFSTGSPGVIWGIMLSGTWWQTGAKTLPDLNSLCRGKSTRHARTDLKQDGLLGYYHLCLGRQSHNLYPTADIGMIARHGNKYKHHSPA